MGPANDISLRDCRGPNIPRGEGVSQPLAAGRHGGRHRVWVEELLWLAAHVGPGLVERQPDERLDPAQVDEALLLRELVGEREVGRSRGHIHRRGVWQCGA